MAVLKRAVPWWSLPLNWLVGEPALLVTNSRNQNDEPELRVQLLLGTSPEASSSRPSS